MTLANLKIVLVTVCLVFALLGCGGGGNSGSSSGTATPTITTQPITTTVVEGGSATLTVVATGSSLTYQWYKTDTAISGATSATYSIASATTTDAGNYYVKVSNSTGSVTSSTVKVIVSASLSAPTIMTEPIAVTATLGSSTGFTVLASGAYLNYQWYKDGTAITGATSYRYLIGATTSDDAGNYYVTVKNDAGTVTSKTVSLTISATTVAPKITAQPTSVTVSEGTATNFTVTATGTSLAYQWYKDGTAIGGATTATLAIASASTADVGSYNVVVSNSGGSVSSNTVTLALTNAVTAPKITSNPSSLSVGEGGSATFTVVATGANLTYQWYKDSVALPSAKSASYSISYVLATDAGVYHVVVTNSAGTATSTDATLTVTSSVYKQSGGSATKSGQIYISSTADESAVYVLNGGVFNLSSSTVKKSGDSSNSDNSSKYGLNAAVLAESAAAITLTGTSVYTTGLAANGLFATGSGSSISMTSGTISTTAAYAHGAAATYGGAITLNGAMILASGANGSAIAADYGSGSVTVTNGTYTASGANAAGISSAGSVTVSGATVSSTSYNGAVLDAGGALALTDTTLKGATNGILVKNTSGSTYAPTVKISGGSVTASSGDAFYVSGATPTFTLADSATLTTSTGVFVDAVNSAKPTFTLDNLTLTGNLFADTSSTVVANILNTSVLKGKLTRVALRLDATSIWKVTANSVLTTLTDASGISGTTITNIVGNGYTVTYDSTLDGNTLLDGKTYTLVNGGTLKPE